jgi:uncharacterized membrane protein
MFLTTFIKVFIVLLLVDSVYLYFLGDWANTMVVKIQRLYSPVRYFAAAVVYLFLALGLTYFIIEPKKNMFDAALLGLIVYGVFDFTNLALFKHYDLRFALVDTIWGAALLGITTWIVQQM